VKLVQAKATCLSNISVFMVQLSDYRYPKFQGVSNITLHFPTNFGGDATRISFIGFQGEATQVDLRAFSFDEWVLNLMKVHPSHLVNVCMFYLGR
jgi:hypothetical protein